MSFAYIEKIRALIDTVEAAEAETMEAVAALFCRAILDKKAIYAFGASHAGIIVEELFYRAGGLMPVNPIFGQELALSTQPIMTTSRMERLEGYGTVLAQKVNFAPGDVLLVHSVSGRNPVGIEMALAGKSAGATVVGLVNLAYSTSVASKHSSGKRLPEICDYVLDNHGEKGDAACAIPGMSQKVGPTSTVVGALLVNAITVRTVELLRKSGLENPPIFHSANVDGGDELNRRLFSEYEDSIHYRL